MLTSGHLNALRTEWQDAGTFDKANPGFWIALLDELSERAGFSWRDRYGLLLPFENNGTTDELLTWAVDVYDFSFSEWDRTIDRIKMGVDFPYGFSDSSTILIARNTAEDESTFHVFSFLAPFDFDVWGSLVATIVFTGLVYRCISRTYSIGQSTTQPRDEEASEHGEIICKSTSSIFSTSRSH